MCTQTRKRLATHLLTPWLQIEQHVKAQQGISKGLRIVGYYQCNERLSDSELGGGRRVADRIEAAYPESVALVVSCRRGYRKGYRRG
jgi:hypothetical protein